MFVLVMLAQAFLAVLALGTGVCLLLFFAHFIPSFVAFARHHPARWAILLVNIFFGWTIVGWAITLIWALTGPPIMVVPYPPPGGPGRARWG